MKNFFALLLFVSILNSCEKQIGPITIQNNLEEQLSEPAPPSDYWTFKLFSPSWLGRRSGMSCFVIGGYAYVFGGYDHANISLNKDLYRYDPVTNTYTQKAGMPYPGLSRMQAVAFTINNKGYIATGYATGLLNDLWEYDPAVGMGGTWTKKADLPAAGRWRAIGFSINNKGYIATGNINGPVLKDMWEYDAVADSWTQKANMPTIVGRDEAFVFVVGSKAYIGGGKTPGQLPSFWEFNPSAGANGTWTQKANYPGLAKEKISAYATNTSGYVGTGSSRTEDDVIVYYQDFWRYSPSTNTWTKREDFPGYKRDDALGFTINGIGYMGLGYNQVYTSTNDLFRYHP